MRPVDPQIARPGRSDDVKGTSGMTISRPMAGPVADGPIEGEAERAERVLAGLLPPADASQSPAVLAVRLALTASLVLFGAGVVLAGPVLAWLCLAAITGWLGLAGAQMLALRRPGRAAELAEAAAVHSAGLPGRVPAGTLAAARRHLPAAAKAMHRDRAWLYVAPCPGPDRPCSVFCGTAAALPLGRQVLVVLGEHPAARPEVAASALAHETGHHTVRWLWQVHYARTTLGWGWAIAGLAGATAGGPAGAVIAAALFWLVSLLLLWAGETGCDLRAVRTEGYPAVLAGFRYMAVMLASRPARPGTPPPAPSRSRTARKTVLAVLDWTNGPAHPPLRLRRALVRALARPGTDATGRPEEDRS
jgi:hypothetical protein